MRLDPDDLAAAAVDGSDDLAPTEDEDRATLDAYRRIVATGRSLDDDDRADDDPPPELWDRISAAATRDAAAEPAGPAPVVSLDARRRTPWILAAAAVVVLVVVGAAIVTVSRDGSGREVVASADLAVVDGGGAGSAELVRRDDGLHLVVDVADLTPAQRADFFELWLLTAEGTDPQPIDTFTEADGVVDAVVPEGVDTSRFPVVDISEERRDGDATHSGRSILRGTLQ